MEAVSKHDMVHRFFEFLSIDSPNNNIHNIRVCRILVATSVVTSQTLRDLHIPEKVNSLYMPTTMNCVRWCMC